MSVNPEYLRRNLLVCSAIGANANAKAALKRLRTQKRPAKWLVSLLEGIEERTAKLPGPLACYRSAVPVTVEMSQTTDSRYLLQRAELGDARVNDELNRLAQLGINDVSLEFEDDFV